MFRRFIVLFAVTALFISNYSCHETETQRTALNWWDSLREANADSLVLAPMMRELNALLSAKCIDSTTTSYLIIDDTDDVPVILAEHHPNRLLIPASVQKILVTASALEILGDKVRKDVNTCNLNSNNALANKLIKNIGKSVYGDYSYASGTRAVMEFWESRGVDMHGVRLVDGSGRNYDNALTVRNLVDILFYLTTAPTFGTFYSSLPLAGISGTMRNTLKGTVGQGKIRAKTGTLASVKSLTGYASTKSGRKLIFAIIVNNYTCRNSVLKKMMERVLIEMVEL